MINLPLALIGGVAGVFLGDGVLSIAALIGFIALFGIATRNGIMLVSHIRRLREEEGVLDVPEAVMRGSIDRLVPIVMTALSTGLALLPVALRFGEPGSEIQAPLALVIVCGLFSSTALNMFVVPAVILSRRTSPAAGHAGLICDATRVSPRPDFSSPAERCWPAGCPPAGPSVSVLGRAQAGGGV